MFSLFHIHFDIFNNFLFIRIVLSVVIFSNKHFRSDDKLHSLLIVHIDLDFEFIVNSILWFKIYCFCGIITLIYHKIQIKCLQTHAAAAGGLNNIQHIIKYLCFMRIINILQNNENISANYCVYCKYEFYFCVFFLFFWLIQMIFFI